MTYRRCDSGRLTHLPSLAGRSPDLRSDPAKSHVEVQDHPAPLRRGDDNRTKHRPTAVTRPERCACQNRFMTDDTNDWLHARFPRVILAGVAVAVSIGLGATGATASTDARPPKLPAHFPKPPGSSVQSKKTTGKETLYLMTVKSEPQAFKYWKKELPKHGWKIKKAVSKDGKGIIEFTGHGYTKGTSAESTGISVSSTSADVGFYK
jgi:hypothetical protein